MRKTVLLSLIIIVGFVGCAKTYTSSTFPKQSKNHEIIAILPFDVTLTPHHKDSVTAEALKEIEESEGYMIQREFYSRMLRKKDMYNYNVEFLDSRRTNTLLEEANIDYSNLNTMDMSELAQILNVDAILYGYSSREKPMSDAGAAVLGVATTLLFGGGMWASTNTADMSLKLYDGSNNELLWTFDQEVSGSTGTTAADLAEVLAKSASRKLPYRN